MAEVMKLSEEEVNTIKEPLLKWDPETGKFGANFEIQYSAYLTDYGYDDPEAYRKPAQSSALRLNNLVKKIKEKKPFTKVNDNTLVECAKFFPEAEQIINDLKEKYAKV